VAGAYSPVFAQPHLILTLPLMYAPHMPPPAAAALSHPPVLMVSPLHLCPPPPPPPPSHRLPPGADFSVAELWDLHDYNSHLMDCWADWAGGQRVARTGWSCWVILSLRVAVLLNRILVSSLFS
jgi:hypothetical protein